MFLEGAKSQETEMSLVSVTPCLTHAFTTVMLPSKPLQNSVTSVSSHLFSVLHLHAG